MRYFPQDNIKIKIRQVEEEITDKSYPWGYFDGVENGDLRRCRASGYLYFSDNHWYSFKASLREGSNNFVQLSALRILLRLTVEHEALNLQIYGDSQIIIKWITGQNKIHYVQLIMLLDEVHRLISLIGNVEIKHIYRERNVLADERAKAVVEMQSKDLGLYLNIKWFLSCFYLNHVRYFLNLLSSYYLSPIRFFLTFI